MFSEKRPRITLSETATRYRCNGGTKRLKGLFILLKTLGLNRHLRNLNLGGLSCVLLLIVSVLLSQTSFGSTPKGPVLPNRPFFERNQGQFDEPVQFLARDRGLLIGLTESEILLFESQSSSPFHNSRQPSLSLQFVNGAGNVHPKAEERLSTKLHYYKGRDAENWLRNIPCFGSVTYEDIYPLTDLEVHFREGPLQYDLVVHPGADPKLIKIRLDGATGISLRETGDLTVQTESSQIVFARPHLFQIQEGEKLEVDGSFKILGKDSVTFQIGSYDPEKTLIIDPVLLSSSYLGGSGFDLATGIALTPEGDLVIVGLTSSADFLELADDPAFRNYHDTFVARFDTEEESLEYVAFFGGSGKDFGLDVTVDQEGIIIFGGTTRSPDFPTKLAYQDQFGGHTDLFLTAISPDGQEVHFSTYLGGSEEDGMYGAVDLTLSGEILIGGYSGSSDFPVKMALQETNAGGFDAIVARFTSNGELAWSTFLGGSHFDFANTIATGPDESVYLAGETRSEDFPTVNPLQISSEPPDAFVAKISPDGSHLVYSTYLGGILHDEAFSLAVDDSGRACVVGNTNSSFDFPTINPLQEGTRGSDAFASILDPAGSSLEFSTFLGGHDYDAAYYVTFDTHDRLLISGSTRSTSFPTMNPIQEEHSPLNRDDHAPFRDDDVFITQVDLKKPEILFSTYFGGSEEEVVCEHLSDGSDLYLIGATYSPDFPIKNPLVTPGFRDQAGFVSRVSLANHTYFAQFGDGAGLTSDIILTNPSKEFPVEGEIEFYDDHGSPLFVELSTLQGGISRETKQFRSPLQKLEFVVQPQGVFMVSTDGQSEEPLVGSATVISDGNVGAVSSFRIQGIGTTSVSSGRPLSQFLIPVRRGFGGFNTGVAIQNTETSSISLNLTLRDTDGALIGSSEPLGLEAKGHLARFLHELFPDVDTTDFLGTLTVQVDGGRAAAVALELGENVGEFTSFPVTPIE